MPSRSIDDIIMEKLDSVLEGIDAIISELKFVNLDSHTADMSRVLQGLEAQFIEDIDDAFKKVTESSPACKRGEVVSQNLNFCRGKQNLGSLWLKQHAFFTGSMKAL
ncbi:hypothetical protein Ancab_002158 [Ancistrocladus abbreviatus]